MSGPRDTNRVTGGQLTEHQQNRLDAIEAAGEALYEAMHHAEGSIMPGEHQEHVFQSRRMAHAATLLETVLMFARKAALQ